MKSEIAMSARMKEYFDQIELEVNRAYAIANQARSLGLDPDCEVSIPLASNMAERVEALVGVVASDLTGGKLSARISEIEKERGGQDWRVAFQISLEVAQEKFCKFKDKKEACEVALRVGLAYLTNGVVASPLEGFVRLELKKRMDNTGEFFALFFSGPIRSAGTTATCIFVALADYVRRNMGYAVYDPTEEEVNRYASELEFYHERITNLQYLPSKDEIVFMIQHLPVQIDGDGSEDLEVNNYKDVPRFATNRLRNGVCLVIGEGLTQKASKFYGKFDKYKKELGMKDWEFLEEFVKLQKNIRAKKKTTEESKEKVKPDYNFIKDLVAGRPVVTYPLRTGGLRLRYGRSRVNGFSMMALSPATMVIMDNYIAIGTQFKVERPGKSAVIASCDSIEGPIVKLKNGDVVFVENEEQARKIVNEVQEIIFLGDVLVNYGDFFNRAHMLIPPGYCEEWWFVEFEEGAKRKLGKYGILEVAELAGVDKEIIVGLFKDFKKFKVDFESARKLSEKFEIPLHPRWTYHWKDINDEQFVSLLKWLELAVVDRTDGIRIVFPSKTSANVKRVLELIAVPHVNSSNEFAVISGDDAKAFAYSLGFYDKDIDFQKLYNLKGENTLEKLNNLILLRDKSGYFIGARMGRPEKAKMRQLTGSPHGLFPVGNEGGRMRSIQGALEKGFITAEVPIYKCKRCGGTIYPLCPSCGEKTEKIYFCKQCGVNIETENCEKHGKAMSYKEMKIDIKELMTHHLKNLKLSGYPDLIKGVRGVSNEAHIPENLAKGILRAANEIYVNKDGTTRYDMTEMMVTHFKPKEIGTSIERLKKLGYEFDVYGKPLEDESQILEMKAQDIILPACEESPDEGADKVLVRVSNFVDDMLEKIYGLERYYNASKSEDLVGHLVIGLSPHTTAGIAGRIIGFSGTQGFLTHPFYHSFMRRDCDGDEAGIMLMMDALLNFSRKFLPAHRGATQDEPIVLTSTLIPVEVDDMCFDIDVVDKYPLEFYQAAMEYKMPWDVKITKYSDWLNTEKQFEGAMFTHDTENFNNGVRCSAYKSIPSMQDKVLGQMKMAEKIRAVDENDVARLIIERHFIRDIKGNLRKFSMQQFRCVACNDKYRRPPLAGKCKCGGKIIFTIAEGSIVKYLEPALSLAKRYNLPPYLKQSLDLVKRRIESVFSKDSDKQEGLGKWFG
ncbi:DNA polymerase II large subunit [Candidatus Woesearchaeota archaeon]|nr:DNA polymerase II large subunit [Candidatus Woesearchaeota archaeon]